MNHTTAIDNPFCPPAKCQRLVAAGAALALSALALPSLAAGMHAHAHGVAELTVAMEGDVLEVAFVSPAASVIGFEHRAHTESEKNAANNAKAILEQPNALLSFTGSECELLKTSVDIASILPSSPGSGVKNGDHSHADHEQENHSEISAHYNYQCKGSDFPSTLELRFFSVFHGIEKIDVMWIGAAAQGGATVTQKNNTIEFK